MCYYHGYRYGPYYKGQHAGYGPWSHRFNRGFRQVPVNIQEHEDAFELCLFAPALDKNLISISVKDDVLTISYRPKEEEANSGQNFTRREYRNESFERSFVLNGKVNVAGIHATYTDGILKVVLPKDPNHNQPAQNVPVD